MRKAIALVLVALAVWAVGALITSVASNGAPAMFTEPAERGRLERQCDERNRVMADLYAQQGLIWSNDDCSKLYR